MIQLSDSEFTQFQRLLLDAAGIFLSDSKRALVGGRLASRLTHHGISSYTQYLQLLGRPDATLERQTAIDLLTTNETYFFREPRHFDFLRAYLLRESHHARPIRVWSAAGSSGEEAYSIAMLLEDLLHDRPWEVLCSDISTRMLQRARRGHYQMCRLDNVPAGYLRRFCLQGQDAHAGTMLVSRELRGKVRFAQINLNAQLPAIGPFDVIFLRNVLIYFNAQTKREVLERVQSVLRPGGYLFIGHSESLSGLCGGLEQVAPAIFLKPTGSPGSVGSPAAAITA